MDLTSEITATARPFEACLHQATGTLALDVIQEVGPGGDYLAHEHTLAHFREFWQPALFSRLRRSDWARRGSKRLGDRLRERTIQTMEAHRPEPLPGGVRDEIAYILKQG